MRSSLAMGLALALLVTSATALAGQHERPTYVLVHGAFHGGWAWQELANKLRDDRARVYTPTLSGLGERAHTAHVNIGLGTHIQDIVALLEFEDLHDVILVGHSYAGMVITGVAAAVPHRVSKLVYFDAAIPEPGQSFFDAIAFSEPLPPDATMMASFPPEAFGVTAPEQVAYVGPRLRAQPLATLMEPLAFDWSALAGIPKTYIHCTGEWFAREPFLAFRAKALARGWEYFQIEASHDAMVTATRETYRIFRRLDR
jgi:pimeloyl-ACP methyl ester carboxylesterase